MMKKLLFAQALLAIVFASHLFAEEVVIAKGGRAQMPIVIPNDGGPLAMLAKELKGYLDQITGADFEITSKPRTRGIILGTREQFPKFLSEPVKQTAPTGDERYRIVSKDRSLHLIGETNIAVRDAIFDFLAAIGYRQYFPNPAWEVIPSKRDLSVNIDRTEEPGYATRYLFYGSEGDPRIRNIFGLERRSEEFEAWKRKNRGLSAFTVNTGHNWHRIAQRHPEEFAKNPDWYSGKQEGDWSKASGKGWKYRVDNEGLRKLLRQDVLDWFKQNPEAGTFSIDPTDGGGWPEKSSIGTPSDQMVFLANDLVASLKKDFPDKKLAFYAYYMHSPPPKLQLKGNTIVNVATGFITGGWTVEKLMKEWKAKGAELGIRDYTNVFFGSWDLPGGNYLNFSPDKSLANIRRYYQDGARYWISETDDAWGAIGLGTYITFQTLWNPLKGPSVEEIKADFLKNSFGAVADIVRKYYDIIDPKNKPIVSPDLTARMYDVLLEALDKNKDERVRERLLHLLSYTRFVELMYQFRSAADNERVAAYKDLAEWAMRYRESGMFSTVGVFTRIGLKEGALKPAAEELLSNPVPPLKDDELIALARTQAKNSQRMGFSPVAFSADLVKSGLLSKPVQETYELSRKQTLLWLAKKEGDVLEISARGLGRTADNLTPITATITHVDDPLEAPSDTKEIIPDKQWHTAKLKAGQPGLYKLTILDPSSYLEIKWPAGTPVVFPVGQQEQGMPRAKTAFSGWIYIPAGADRVAGYSESFQGQLLDDKGGKIFDFSTSGKAGYFDVKIAPMSVARAFKLQDIKGKIVLMTTPPYIARSPSELLVPKETLKR